MMQLLMQSIKMLQKMQHMVELIEHSIPEELDHAKRLEEAMSACGIEF